MNRSTRIFALVIGLLPALSCGEDTSSPLGKANIIMGFSAASNGGSFSATVDGRTFKTPGGWPISLSELGKTYEVSGTFSGNSFRVEFATSTQAGVQSGSIVSEEGPAPRILTCQIEYLPTTNGPHTFKFQFKTTATNALICP